ncbi:MAG TPA: ribonuclease HII [Victivallales bacterium]|nr:ribonuclease HII [Victivallales bacterium]
MVKLLKLKKKEPDNNKLMNCLDNLHPMLSFEMEKWDDGIIFIAGIDEVGRGPIAGPVVAAAVIFDKNKDIPVVDDSKKLTEKKRNIYYKNIIKTDNIQYSVAEVDVDLIDEINILQATHLAMKKAVSELPNVEFALIDGLPVKNFTLPNTAIVKGDSKSASIAAASIIAKVYRDNLMIKYSLEYPEYSFEKNKGYGTVEHLNAIKKYGPCPIHRKSFAPVSDYYIVDKKIQQKFKFE